MISNDKQANQRKGMSFITVLLLCLIINGGLTFGSLNKVQACPKQPAIYNLERLKELRRENPQTNRQLRNFLQEADIIAKAKPITVMDKSKSFAENPHTYCSLSRYAWPSEKDPKLYVIRDGQTNPEWDSYDLPKLDLLSSRIKTLGTAYYITKESKYYDAFCRQLRAWFLDEDTYMEPNLEYAQVQPGKNNNKGMSYGLVDLNRFTPVIESVFLVQSEKKLDRETRLGLEQWFAELLEWTLNSEQWENVGQGNNNIVAALYVTLVEMARFTGDKETLERLSKEYKDRVLDIQIDEEGKQPAELKRTIGFGYAVGNLNNIIDFCLIMEQSGIHFYRDNQQKIDSAFEYLLQFVGNHEAFPYQQIQGWEGYEVKLERNAGRLKRMSGGKSKIYDNARAVTTGPSNETVMNYVY